MSDPASSPQHPFLVPGAFQRPPQTSNGNGQRPGSREVFQTLPNGIVSAAPLKIYCGMLGQIGDIVMFTSTLRRLKELFPNSSLTFAVSRKYREAGELVAGLPYVDRLFVTELYFEKLDGDLYHPWHLGWPADLRGDDEIAEERKHDLVFDPRPRHRRMPWWEYDHQVAEAAHMVGIPGPIDLRTEIAIPPKTELPADAVGKIVLHNDPDIDRRKAWPWQYVRKLVEAFPPYSVVLIGRPGPRLDGVLDLRGRTTLAQSAAIIATSRCFVGIESGPTVIAGALQVPTVGLFGTVYIAAYQNVQPVNPNAVYLQAEGALDEIRPAQVIEAVQQRLRDTG